MTDFGVVPGGSTVVVPLWVADASGAPLPNAMPVLFLAGVPAQVPLTVFK